MEEDMAKRKTISPIVPGTFLARRPEQAMLARGFDDIFSEFRKSFDNLIRPFFPLATDEEEFMVMPTRYAQVDMIDNGDSYIVAAELPGFRKDQVDVQVNKDAVFIQAECKGQKEEKRKNYLHRERAYSSIQRVVTFPEEVVPSKVEGTMKDGLLELKVPKKEPKPEEKPQKVELK